MFKLFRQRVVHFLHQYIQQQWQHRHIFSQLLLPITALFSAVAALRRLAYQKKWLPTYPIKVPIIVIGNLMVGGTGKTPVVIALTHILRQAGFNPGVISRGYGAKKNQEPQLVSTHSDANLCGDEPILIAKRTHAPVCISSNRVAAAQTLLIHYPRIDVIISDDGLQHYRLQRNIEIVIFDNRLAGNGRLLPAGPLRESLSRKRHANLISLAKNQALPNWPNTFQIKIGSTYAWQLTQPEQHRPLHYFQKKSLLAAAGIGNPEKFFQLLREHGLKLETYLLPDHYSFHNNPFDFSNSSNSFINHSYEYILITEKDAVKCQSYKDDRIWVVAIDIDLSQAFERFILEKLNEC